MEIDASAGMNTSHVTPAVRAARAAAWAWLPAEATTMPGAAPAPREASLADAPRILNDPVFCRFSAFKTTCDPVSSVSTRLSKIGVRIAACSTAGADALDLLETDVRVARSRLAQETAYSARTSSTMSSPASVGLIATRTPAALRASIFALAVPFVPEMMAPAWPIFLPGGAVTPAM